MSSQAQWTTSELSIPRSSTVTTVSGDKLIFASGSASGDQYEPAKKRVDIFNVTEDTWTATDLSIIRQYTFVEAINNKLYFAGYTQTFADDQDVVEVYDLETGVWNNLEFPSIYGATSLTSIGDLLVGVKGSSVDIYNTTTAEWTSHELSAYRILAKAQGCNGKIFFAGGGSYVQGTFNTIDIYNVSENTWSLDTLGDHKNGVESVCIDEHVFFMGGGIDFNEVSSIVEKINTVDGTKEVIEIEGLEVGKEYAATDNYLYIGIEEIEDNDYVLVRRMDLISYDLDTLYIPTPRFNIGMLAHDNKVYFAGGVLLSIERTSLIDIYSELSSSTDKQLPNSHLSIYPNPAHDFLHIQGTTGSEKYQIHNLIGQKVREGITSKSISVNNLNSGIYYLKVENEVLPFAKL